MNINATSQVAKQHSGVWNRLNSEREDIREALLHERTPTINVKSLTREGMASTSAASVWHRTLLQNRLGKVDDALDRLAAGTYGNCSKCGRWIEDTKLEFDPAIAFCVECWSQSQLKH